MKYPTLILTCILTTAILYPTLVLTNIVPLPVWLNSHSWPAFQAFHRALELSLSSSQNHTTTGGYATQAKHSASSFALSSLWVDLRGLRQSLSSDLYGTPIGGAWIERSLKTMGPNRTLPDCIVFAPEIPEDPAIPTSSNDGHLNSRIDLQRRKRAFNKQANNPISYSSVLLHLRDDALFQSKEIDPAVLVSQLHEAIKRNQDIERRENARKLRKSKKKGGKKKNAY
ncbi:transmembrane protein [Ceratobasidium sp. AG-Ba]|nr:transmembrane protein [Ceratobasidium sp. AG-Ba]